MSTSLGINAVVVTRAHCTCVPVKSIYQSPGSFFLPTVLRGVCVCVGGGGGGGAGGGGGGWLFWCCLSFVWLCGLSVLVFFISFARSITKTCLYNFDPLKTHFYIVKLRFIGVYIIFLISAQNIDCGYSLESPGLGEAVLTSTNNLCFEQKYEKYQNFLSENFHFFWWENFQYIWIGMFS